MSNNGGGRLTTHVLDTASGRPGVGMTVDLYRLSQQDRTHLKRVQLNSDGRTDQPLLAGQEFSAGQYELVFAAGDYLRRQGIELPSPAFLDEIPIRFGMADAKHYHVPLLISPYGYSTYRGS
ncbi:MAG: uraH [Rhizobiaceae bacterium]|jgi:5-hydroxyisourate hydrolase|nr:uraH [Rhizobiaceae bacterium]